MLTGANKLDLASHAIPGNKELDLSGNPGVMDVSGDFVDWYLLTHLEELVLANCGVTSRQLKCFAGCPPPSLKKLDLSGNRGVLDVSSGDFVDWYLLTHLEELVVSECGVTSRQLKCFAGCPPPSLKKLDLSGNRGVLDVSSGDFVDWHLLEHLEELILANCAVTAVQMESLMELLPGSTALLDLGSESRDATPSDALEAAGFTGHHQSGRWQRPVQHSARIAESRAGPAGCLIA
ncbi:unnamed protein product [Prorocentrum cordatum]|uniref:Uncharacterized protein n=1 Tax=Prorocentrum cordatum TaxID=2364126 RepID=A0ABN9R048_9DINO|nr:unnamed protein product [Polarella glacialis]